MQTILPMCTVSVCQSIRQSVCHMAEFDGVCSVCGVIWCSLCQIILASCSAVMYTYVSAMCIRSNCVHHEDLCIAQSKVPVMFYCFVHLFSLFYVSDFQF